MTPTDRRPIDAFRRRLDALLHEKFQGHYTLLAKRAGIPISSMQHYMHTAKHLPGGEHLLRLAEALDTTADFLLTGIHSVRPQDLLSTPVNVVKAGGTPTNPQDKQLSVPVFSCTCPKTCILSGGVPDPRRAIGRLVVPVDMVRAAHLHRLIGIALHEGLMANGQTGRAVVDWDSRAVTAQEKLYLYFDGRQHRIGPLRKDGDTILVVSPASVLPSDAEILGCVCAILAKC